MGVENAISALCHAGGIGIAAVVCFCPPLTALAGLEGHGGRGGVLQLSLYYRTVTVPVIIVKKGTPLPLGGLGMFCT